ncbi:MAG: hypothetical protein QOD69_1840, partial [Solirubrobacteraceae bacterium]|nr:hypothetical protein [Solirubrobacteraceae bacterium]
MSQTSAAPPATRVPSSPAQPAGGASRPASAGAFELHLDRELGPQPGESPRPAAARARNVAAPARPAAEPAAEAPAAAPNADPAVPGTESNAAVTAPVPTPP